MKKTVDVLIPTYRPGAELEALLVMLEQQTYPISHIRIVNTQEELWNQEVQERHPQVKVRHIAREAFDHGKTRGELAAESSSDVLLFMTQDAVPENAFLVEKLVQALEQEGVKAAYARQLAREDGTEAETYTRLFNYPKKSFVKTKADLPKMGIKTYFCSNVCAAYDRAAYEALGGFVKRTIFNEDMIFASRVIAAGYGIAYAAEARVVHSHNYTGRQQFKRNFDLGVSQAEYPEVFAGLPSEGEGFKLVRQTAAHLVSVGKWMDMPSLVWQSGCKYLGYRLGKTYRSLPRKLVLACTMSPGYWKSGK